MLRIDSAKNLLALRLARQNTAEKADPSLVLIYESFVKVAVVNT
jgi:hypothetical protein